MITDEIQAGNGIAAKRGHMGLVDHHEAWKPLLAAAACEGIGSGRPRIVIQQVQTWIPEERRLRSDPEIEIEIRTPETWAMDRGRRDALETKLRAYVKPEWNTPALVFVWRKPVDVRWATALLGAGDRLTRDWRRRRIDDGAWRRGGDMLSAIHKRIWDQDEDDDAVMDEIAAVLTEARRHPPPPTVLPPLPEGQVDVAEVVAVLLRIVDGSTVIRLPKPEDAWSSIYHGIGTFHADGWTFQVFKRSEGMKYVQNVVSPDGRTGGYDVFEAREGNPFSLLENEEQDVICDLLDAIRPISGDRP